MTIAFNLSTLLNSTTTNVANSSTNIAGGSAGQLLYQSASGVTTFTAAGTAGQYLQSNGTSAPTWGAVATTNLAGGAAGAVVYQSGVTATSFTSVGVAGQFLQSNGASSPSWVSTATSSQYLANSSGLVPLTPVSVWAAAAPVALTDASTVAVDFGTGINFSLLTTAGVGSTRAIGNPTNVKPGQTGWIAVTQSSGGNNAVTFSNQWHFSTGSNVTVSSAANAVDIVYYTAITSSYILGTIAKQWY